MKPTWFHPNPKDDEARQTYDRAREAALVALQQATVRTLAEYERACKVALTEFDAAVAA